MMTDHLGAYVLCRAVACNLGLFALVPAQRRASRAFFSREAQS